MDLDDELRRAGATLDAASRAHRPSRGARPEGKAPWVAVAAAALVVAVGVGVFLLGSGDDSPATTPVTDPSGATTPETTAAETTQPVLTNPPATTAPPAVDTGYRCLTSQSVEVAGIVVSFERQPSCSATNMVLFRMAGTSRAECSGPPTATVGAGVTMRFDARDTTYWDTDGVWREATGDEPAPDLAVVYLSSATATRPVVLPDELFGESSFTFEMTCAGETYDVVLPFTLAPADPAVIEIVRVDEDAEYYGACGNETASFSGETWYPLRQAEQELLDPDLYPLPAPPASGLRAPAVMPPGPGDDVGTFVVYSDGMGRYESDSGRVIWLTQEAREFAWVC